MSNDSQHHLRRVSEGRQGGFPSPTATTMIVGGDEDVFTQGTSLRQLLSHRDDAVFVTHQSQSETFNMRTWTLSRKGLPSLTTAAAASQGEHGGKSNQLSATTSGLPLDGGATSGKEKEKTAASTTNNNASQRKKLQKWADDGGTAAVVEKPFFDYTFSHSAILSRRIPSQTRPTQPENLAVLQSYKPGASSNETIIAHLAEVSTAAAIHDSEVHAAAGGGTSESILLRRKQQLLASMQLSASACLGAMHVKINTKEVGSTGGPRALPSPLCSPMSSASSPMPHPRNALLQSVMSESDSQRRQQRQYERSTAVATNHHQMLDGAEVMNGANGNSPLAYPGEIQPEDDTVFPSPTRNSTGSSVVGGSHSHVAELKGLALIGGTVADSLDNYSLTMAALSNSSPSNYHRLQSQQQHQQQQLPQALMTSVDDATSACDGYAAAGATTTAMTGEPRSRMLMTVRHNSKQRRLLGPLAAIRGGEMIASATQSPSFRRVLSALGNGISQPATRAATPWSPSEVGASNAATASHQQPIQPMDNNKVVSTSCSAMRRFERLPPQERSPAETPLPLENPVYYDELFEDQRMLLQQRDIHKEAYEAVKVLCRNQTSYIQAAFSAMAEGDFLRPLPIESSALKDIPEVELEYMRLQRDSVPVMAVRHEL